MTNKDDVERRMSSKTMKKQASPGPTKLGGQYGVECGYRGPPQSGVRSGRGYTVPPPQKIRVEVSF